MAHPIEVEGIIRKSDAGTTIELTGDVRGDVGVLDTLTEGQPIRLILWDARPIGDRSNIEQITEVQQLPRAVVALGLKTKGALSSNEVLKRLQNCS